ncbi:MAG TPA: hypothetical protein VJ464_30605 [Blastocatellia bacterium]|nr:hypothetical protein [Blastocatellia bacterium]
MSIEQWSRRSGEWQAVDFAGAAAPDQGRKRQAQSATRIAKNARKTILFFASGR